MSQNGGLAVAYEGGVVQGCPAQGGLGGNEGGGSPIPRYQLGPFILWRVGRVISGTWWRGGTVGCLGKMPRSSYHWVSTACHSKGRLEWSARGSPAGK